MLIYLLVSALIVVFVFVCIWELIPSMQNLETNCSNTIESFDALPPPKLSLPKPFKLSVSTPPTDTPVITFKNLQSKFTSPLSLSGGGMSFVFSLSMNVDVIPTVDLMAFETETDYHRITFSKNGPSRIFHITTGSFETTPNKNHTEAIRLYETREFREKTSTGREGFQTTTDEIRAKKYVPESGVYAVVYDGEHSYIYENGVTTHKFAEIVRTERVMDLEGEDTLLYIGSSDLLPDITSCLVTNFSVYNVVLTEKILDAMFNVSL